MSGPGPLLRAGLALGLSLAEVVAGNRDRDALELFRDLSDWTPAEAPDRDFWTTATTVALTCREPGPLLAWLRRAAAVEPLDLWLEFVCDPRTAAALGGAALDHLGLEAFRRGHFHTAVGVGLDGVGRDLDFRGLAIPRDGLALSRCHGLRRLDLGPPRGDLRPGLTVSDCDRLKEVLLPTGCHHGPVRIDRCPALERLGPEDLRAEHLSVRGAPSLALLPPSVTVDGDLHLQDLPRLWWLPRDLYAGGDLRLEGVDGPPEVLAQEWTARGTVALRGVSGVRRFSGVLVCSGRGTVLEDWPDLEHLDVCTLGSNGPVLLKDLPRLRRITGSLFGGGTFTLEGCPALESCPSWEGRQDP